MTLAARSPIEGDDVLATVREVEGRLSIRCPRRFFLMAVGTVFLLAGIAAPLGADTSQGSENFSDVPAGHWADEAIGWAVANDITEGVEPGRFDLNGTVPRARLVDFLYRFHNLAKGVPNPAATDTDIAHRDALFDASSEAWDVWRGIREAQVAYQMPELDEAALDDAVAAYNNDAFPAYQAAEDALHVAAAGVATGDTAALTAALSAAQDRTLGLTAAHDALTVVQALLKADRETIEENLDADRAAFEALNAARDLARSNWHARLTAADLEALSARDNAREAATAGEWESSGEALDEWNDALSAYRDDQNEAVSEVEDATSAYHDAVLASAIAQARGSDAAANAADVLEALRTAETQTARALVAIAGSRDVEGDGALDAVRSALTARSALGTAAAAYGTASATFENANDDWWEAYDAREWGGSFADVSPWHWADEAIRWAVATKMTSGVGEGRFDPSGTVTRAQIVTFLYRLHNFLTDQLPSDLPPGSDTFTDVPAGHWADDAVGWAVATKMTSGVGEGRFDPNGTVTRAQIVTFLYRLHNLLAP
ncbi:MAG: S-layer homology domain-containing protein [Acidimicrobiia bacterium]|nr:S-layer homology domain-containing protein [Acidimicrobiia bacterium]